MNIENYIMRTQDAITRLLPNDGLKADNCFNIKYMNLRSMLRGDSIKAYW